MNDLGIEEMMQKLQNHIGEDIIFEGWLYGQKQEGHDVLRAVEPYYNITTDRWIMSFVGYGGAIKSIKLAKTGEVLFYNPSIEDNYDRRDFRDISIAQAQLFNAKFEDALTRELK